MKKVSNPKRESKNNYFFSEGVQKIFPRRVVASLGTRAQLYANVCTRSGDWKEAALLEEEYRGREKGSGSLITRLFTT